jgi:hypothetical protein
MMTRQRQWMYYRRLADENGLGGSHRPPSYSDQLKYLYVARRGQILSPKELNLLLLALIG